MSLTFPRDLFMEMFFPGLGWVDVTNVTSQTEAVSITRGAANEQGRVAPSTLSAVMKNDTGDFSPGNPMGDYYGLLGRNTPVQFGMGLARDTFSRTVVDGLGSTDTGDVWTLDGTAANFDVNGSAATIAISAASTARHAYLAGLAGWADYEVTADVLVPFPNGTSNSAGLIFRGSTTADAWRLSLTVASGGGVTMNIADGAGTLMGSIYTVDTTSAGTYRIRVLVENGTVFGKAWPVAGLVPYDWQVQTTALTGLNATGWMGIRARTGTGASNVTFTIDNVRVRLIRFAGEIADLRPKESSENHKGKKTSLEASGIMRRLAQGRAPIQSAPFRFVTTASPSPVAYWRCEEDEYNSTCEPYIGSSPLVFTATETDHKKHFGKGSLGSYLPPGFSLFGEDADGAFSFGTASLNIPVATEWTFDFIRNGGPWARADLVVTTSTGVWELDLVMTTIGISSVFGPGGTLVDDTTDITIFDNLAHHIRWTVSASGADSLVRVWFDGVLVMNATKTGALPGSITDYEFSYFGAGLGAQPAVAVGHIAIWDTTPPDVADAAGASTGYRGERAGRRVERLCGEQGIPFVSNGDLDDSAQMGPQGMKTITELLEECEDVDMGVLYEPHSVVGIAYRPLSGIQNQTAAATLDYSKKHIGAPLLPVHDDQRTRNKVTVKRTHGGEEFTAEQTSGPLNTNDPSADPDGVGVYDDSGDVNAYTVAQLEEIAQRRVAFGSAEDRRLLARHEAGHAVAAVALGAVVDWCEIGDGVNGSTATRHPDPEASAVIFLAGWAATPFFVDVDHDCREAARLVGHDRAEELTSTAMDLIAANLPAVRAVAEELERRGRLTGGEVKAAMERVSAASCTG